MKYTWLLFDADGTLFDFDRAERLALEKTFQQAGYGFKEAHAKEYARINSGLWVDLEAGKVSPERLGTLRFELLLESLRIEGDAQHFGRSYLGHLGDCPDLINGTEDFLEQLDTRLKLLLITNGLKTVQRSRLAKSTIKGYFADIVISEEVGSAKPDHRIFDEAFHRMGQPSKSEVLIIGDSLSSDIKGGNNYGIDTCWFNPKRVPRPQDAGCTYEVDRLMDLLELLKPVS